MVTVIVVAASISNMTVLQMERNSLNERISLLTKPINYEQLQRMDENGDGVTKLEFLSEMLHQIYDIDKDEIRALKKVN